MVFITRRWKNSLPSLLLMCACLTAGSARSEPAGDLSHNGRIYTVNAQLHIELPDTLRANLQQGVPLDFVAEFDLTGPRWYSWYRAVASGFLENNEKQIRLSYHAISRHYRLSHIHGVQDFENMGDALSSLGRLRDWKVLQVDRFNNRTNLRGRIRMRLDTATLPSSLQGSPLLGEDTRLIDTRWRELRSVGQRRSRTRG